MPQDLGTMCYFGNRYQLDDAWAEASYYVDFLGGMMGEDPEDPSITLTGGRVLFPLDLGFFVMRTKTRSKKRPFDYRIVGVEEVENEKVLATTIPSRSDRDE